MIGTILDIFNSDAFNSLSLTTAIMSAPYARMRIGEMGLFAPDPVPTTAVAVEEKSGFLKVVPVSKRGTPGTAAARSRRTARIIEIPRIAIDEEVLAADLQNIRQFGDATPSSGAAAVAAAVNSRLAELRQSLEITIEFHKIGALQGVIKDSDGSTLLSLFTTFGITETTQDFAFTTSTTDIRGCLMAVKRAIETALGATVFDHVHGFAGADWWDAYIAHADVKTAFDRWQNGSQRRDDLRSGFEHAGVIIEEYRGSIGGTTFIPSTQCRFFPVGVPNLGKVHFGPADFIEAVNTLGQPVYAKQELLEMGRGIKLHTQSNPLPLWHKPATLIKGTMS